MKLRTSYHAFSFVALAVVAGCASNEAGPPDGDDAQVTDVATSSVLTTPKGIATTRVYFGPSNYLTTTSAAPIANALLDVQAKASFRIELRGAAGSTGLGFTLYRVKANGSLALLRSVSAKAGLAKATFKSIAGGSYVVAATAASPTTLVLGFTCLRRDGQCALPGQPGATCGVRGVAPCDDGITCVFDKAAACGAADTPGVCQIPTEVCTLEYLPVCGCDGVTYDSECAAHKAGISAAYDGPCVQPAMGATCGGIGALPCPAGQACQYSNAMCGTADLAGKCVPSPDFCTTIYKPVCSCDGTTYGNSCEALRAGVAVANDGACQP